MGYFLSLSKSSTTLWLEVSEWMLLVSGIVLVVGIIGEIRSSEWGRWLKRFEYIVLIGVAGELVADGGVFLFSAHLQTISDSENAALSVKASGANERAGKAFDRATRAEASNKQLGINLEAEKQKTIAAQLALSLQIASQGPRAKLIAASAQEMVRQLAPFAGQRVSLFVCGQQGVAEQETLDTWGAIANILDDSVAGIAGAKWREIPTNLNWAGNCGAAKGLGQGVIVMVSKRASKGTMEAATILGRGLARALPPSPNKMLSLLDPDFSKLMVDRGLERKDAAWIVPALDPDLIAVLIGEHP